MRDDVEVDGVPAEAVERIGRRLRALFDAPPGAPVPREIEDLMRRLTESDGEPPRDGHATIAA